MAWGGDAFLQGLDHHLTSLEIHTDVSGNTLEFEHLGTLAALQALTLVTPLPDENDDEDVPTLLVATLPGALTKLVLDSVSPRDTAQFLWDIRTLGELDLRDTVLLCDGDAGAAQALAGAQLTRLSLLSSGLDATQRLPITLKELCVDHFTLDQNDVDEDGVLGLLEHLTRLTALEVLALSGCYLGGQVSVDVPVSLAPLKNLFHIALDSNTQPLDAVTDLHLLTRLVHLDLSTSQVAADGLRLPASLQHLDLRNCGLEEVPPGVSTLTALVELDLGGQEVRGGFTALEPLHALEDLDLSEMPLQELPSSLSCLGALQTLRLMDTDIDHDTMTAYSALTALTALTLVDLRRTSNILLDSFREDALAVLGDSRWVATEDKIHSEAAEDREAKEVPHGLFPLAVMGLVVEM